MPYLKVNLQGSKYAISGLSDRTSSKHILCSLARMHSMLSLVESDSTLTESPERNNGIQSNSDPTIPEKQEPRKKRSEKLRRSESNLHEKSRKKREPRSENLEQTTPGLRTRDRRSWPLSFSESSECKDYALHGMSTGNSKEQSSCSSSDVCKWKNKLRRSLSKNCVLGNEKSLTGETRALDTGHQEKKSSKKRSDKKERKHKHKERLPNPEATLSVPSEVERMRSKGKSFPHGCHSEKSRHSKHKHRHSEEKRSHKDDEYKTERYSRRESTKKKLKSENKTAKRKLCENSHERCTDCIIHNENTVKPPRERRSRRHGHCDKDLKYVRKHITSTDSSESEYSGARYLRLDKAHVPLRHQNLRTKDIERLVTKAVERRFPQLSRELPKFEKTSRVQTESEKETRSSLLRLAASQRKCLLAFDKCIKQKASSIARYSKWCDEVENTLKVPTETKNEGTKTEDNLRKESTDKASETDQDTGISEMHSDSSADVRSHSNSDVTGNDITKVIVTSHEIVASKVTRLPLQYMTDSDVISQDVTSSESSDVTKNKTTEHYVIANDVTIPEMATSSKPDSHVEGLVNCHSKQEILIDRLSVVSNVGSTCSAESVTIGMLSDISDTTSLNSSPRCETSETVGMTTEEKFQYEKNRNDALKESIHRVYRDIHLTEARTEEQNKLIELLSKLEELNEEVLESQKLDEKNEEKFTKEDEQKMKTSIELSSKLYEYQKGEFRENANRLQMLESRIRRKRWHVDSIVKELERFITSPLQPKPMSSPELHPEFRAGVADGYVLGSFV